MPAAIAIREDYTSSELRRLAARAKDANQGRRLLALAAVRDGMSQAEAAKIGGMDRQTLRDWVHRFNGEGPEGLVNRPLPGRQGWLSARTLAAHLSAVPARKAIEMWFQCIVRLRFARRNDSPESPLLQRIRLACGLALPEPQAAGMRSFQDQIF